MTRRTLRKVALTLALGLVAMATAVFARSEWMLRRRYPVNAAEVPAWGDSAGVTRGEHLFRTSSCGVCHGPDGGGALYMDAGPIGVVNGPNLTRGHGGVAATRSDLDWVRAIRHGVRPDGASLMVMPSEVFTYLTDQDLGALLGYLRQLPPVDREVPRSRFRWLGRILMATGQLDILVAHKVPPQVKRVSVPPGPSFEYGLYLAHIGGCIGCHGEGLSGGKVAGPPGLPPAANLTPAALAGWSDSTFLTVMRTGRRPSGAMLNDFMPWRELRHLTDEELTALWRYLQSVPPKPFGNR